MQGELFEQFSLCGVPLVSLRVGHQKSESTTPLLMPQPNALAVLLYRKVLQAARRCDAHPLSARALLSAPPSSVFDRRHGKVSELEPDEYDEMSGPDVPVSYTHLTLPTICSV